MNILQQGYNSNIKNDRDEGMWPSYVHSEGIVRFKDKWLLNVKFCSMLPLSNFLEGNLARLSDSRTKGRVQLFLKTLARDASWEKISSARP